MSGMDLEKKAPHRDDSALAPHSSPAPVRYNPDAPSEEWGWHGEWRVFAAKGSKTLLVVFTLVMFALLFGNHVSRVEDWWLVLIGLGMIVWLVWREAAARHRRRTRP